MFNECVAVVLCGGRGNRMGLLTENKPKPLVEVLGKPIIWYIYNYLYSQGIRNFLFPLGYKSETLLNYIKNEFTDKDVNIITAYTGENTSIAKRLFMVEDRLKEFKNVVLFNGDTIVNFDLKKMYETHLNSNKQITLSHMNIKSKYGLILEKDNEIISFKREESIKEFITSENELKAYINAGISIIDREFLYDFDLNIDTCFESMFYSSAIEKKALSKYFIENNIYAFDTQKDIQNINNNLIDREEIEKIKKSLLEEKMTIDKKEGIETRYSYKTRYINDEKDFINKIKNKTIIPHQVEIQPGRENGNKLCWLDCPYCYGGTSENNGERLSLDRYLEIMEQLANGPHGRVDKVIFAGYATDPLNYEHINELLKVAIANKQVTGFHTKSIKLSDDLINNLTQKDIREKSYFSISIDAGTNQSYNIVHGVKNLNAKIYDQVFENIKKLVFSRDKNQSSLDISVTYLLTEYNNSIEEVTKFIEDFKGIGVDLIRFSFPQLPRGMDEEDNKFILNRKNILEVYSKLEPVVNTYNDSKTKVLIFDLDAQYSINSRRELPCFARYIFPTIGFDGRLYNCSESAAPHFHKIQLGNLSTTDFWELFYNYDSAQIANRFSDIHKMMTKLDCRCDRKEHAVNSVIKDIL